MTISDTETNSSDRNRRKLAWAVPVVVAGVIAGGIAVTATSASGASPSLPKRTAAQLIAAVGTSKTAALSGVISETANLGLPSLPGSGQSSASLSWQTFVTGTHSAKVWIDGADKQRVALLGELSEADVVHNGNNLWTYTSASNTVTHTVLPAHDAKTADKPDPSKAGPADLTPAAAADKLLANIDPTTSVTVDSSRTVAGRAAYTLTLRPKGTGSTVSKVTIAVDAKKFVPLQVEVFGSGSSPAFRTGFTDISFATPSASTFDFTAPAGATTTTSSPLTSRTGHRDHQRATPSTKPAAPATPKNEKATPTVIGSGWTSVLELPSGAKSALSGGTLNELTSPIGSSGQRVLRTALVNALVLPDGRTFVGAVTVAVLQHVAATTPR